MAVIINELEVIIEPPKPEKSHASPAKTEPQKLKPLDLKQIAEREEYRRLRVFAH